MIVILSRSFFFVWFLYLLAWVRRKIRVVRLWENWHGYLYEFVCLGIRIERMKSWFCLLNIRLAASYFYRSNSAAWIATRISHATASSVRRRLRNEKCISRARMWRQTLACTPVYFLLCARKCVEECVIFNGQIFELWQPMECYARSFRVNEKLIAETGLNLRSMLVPARIE